MNYMKFYEHPAPGEGFRVDLPMLNTIDRIHKGIDRMDTFDLPSETYRRESMLKSVGTSLAIEGNTLFDGQDFKAVTVRKDEEPTKEVREVMNAYEAYKTMRVSSPFSEEAMKHCQGLMMQSLKEDAGHYRDCDVGVYSNDGLLYMAPPPEDVGWRMRGLFDWLMLTEWHPLVSSSIFHYEFEQTHPFSDGNGRTGRLWQACILCGSNRNFEWVPFESYIWDRRPEYYEAIRRSNSTGDTSHFVRFMLECLESAVKGVLDDMRSGKAFEE